MKAAFIGLPLSGKTTLAGAVTGFTPEPGSMPQLHHAIVKVPDERLALLAKMFNPKKVTEAAIECIDVPGFSLADHKGREDLRRCLPDIRQSEALVAVLRAFDDPTVPAYRDRVDPAVDLNELRDELVFADLETITNRLDKVEKALKKPTGHHEHEKREQALLTDCRDALENESPLSNALHAEEDRRLVAGFGLLTLKPLVVVYNVSEDQAAQPDPPTPENAAAAINLCARTELEIARLEPGDRPEFLADLGVASPARDRLIRTCYDALGLISFLTVAPAEARAWTLQRGGDAVEAAGKVHSDMARGFIRAETIAMADLIEAGDMKTARAAGKVRQEGKHYVVQDGDFIHFKFNV